MQEELFPIKDYEGLYAITKTGKVWSYPKQNGYYKESKLHNGKFLSQCINHKGYTIVQFNHKRYFLHRLIAETFIPNPDKKSQVNHKNCNKLDNRIDNLEWCTHKENMEHAKFNNLTPKGSKNGNSKLTEFDVLCIKKLLEKTKAKDIAEMFNVTDETIYGIKNNMTWMHV